MDGSETGDAVGVTVDAAVEAELTGAAVDPALPPAQPASSAPVTVAKRARRRLTAPSVGAMRTTASALAVVAVLSGCGAQPGAPRSAPAAPATVATPAPAAAPTAPVRELVVVRAARYGTARATVTAYQSSGSRWVRMLGPWTAWIGSHGFAPAGKKREGDGRTPSGTYGFASYFFGVASRPGGIHYRWRHAYSYDVWNDDPRSSRYNLWTDRRTQAAGRGPEPLHVSPAYDYAAVIGYNTSRTPGLGSAIFLHVSHNSPTAGCVSLPRAQLIAILRWLDPTKSPRIRMGVAG